MKEWIGNAAAWLFDQIMKIPLSWRLVIRDCLEGAAVAVASVSWVIPSTREDAQRLAITASVAIGAAVLAVIRRKVWDWLLDKIGKEQE